MKISRFKKWLVFSVIIIPCLLLLERERRILIIIGAWQFLDKDEIQSESKSKFHVYNVFNRDGSGKEIVEEDGVIGSFPFTYELVGLSYIKVESDQSFCGTNIIPWDEDCGRNDGPKSKTSYYNVSIGMDRNIMDLIVPKESRDYVGKNYFRRVAPASLPVEK